MPARTNAFQKLVVLLHQSLGHDTVIESKMFHDAAGDTDREVDVCIYKRSLGREYHVAIECVDWSTPADITWIEQQLGKHRDIPTSALILVSASGFTKSARRKAAHYGVSLINPEADAEWGSDALRRVQDLYMAYVALSVVRCTVSIVVEDDTWKSVNAEPDFGIYDAAGTYIGANIGLLVETLLDNEDLRRQLTLQLGANPEAQFFHMSMMEPLAPTATLVATFPVARRPPGQAPLCDRIVQAAGFLANEGKLERIVNVHVVGRVVCVQGPAKLKMGVIQGKRVFWGNAVVAGNSVLVAAIDHRPSPNIAGESSDG